MRELPKNYDYQAAETKWYAAWEAAGCFRSQPDGRKPYTVVIPPPNVTGVLHMGHMLNNTLQDVLVRRKRMQGYNALWVAGTDHASIATEAKVVALLKEQGIDKKNLSREEFLAHAWAWKEKYGGIILEQLRRLGASCDWSRTRFTMDENYSAQVVKVFVDLYEKGLIYRGERMVNWDPAGKTALSDEEVIHRETDGKLYYIQYELVDAPGEHITIATTRPETIMADTAIAVHPDDERFQHLLGKHARIPLLGREIPIIADTYIDPAFGTGCLKVTPAHDVNDLEIGKRHGLPIIDILNEDGTLAPAAQLYVGQDRFEVRKQIEKDLKAAGALIKTESIRHSVGFSERTHVPVEPRISMQWYVRMQPLAEPALKAVLEPGADGGVKLIPAKFENTYRHWMENIRDWCISRQLWWGHRIPAWYWQQDGENHISVGESVEAAFAKAQATGFRGKQEDLCQDSDVLDTWFSSWLWPFGVFDGILDPQNEDLQYYYPTADLVTAPEILFFWVARMIMAGYHYMGKRPFENVYLTGIVRDKQRRKMSKSLGNSPDPLDLMAKFSADGVRVGMLLTSPAGNDLLFDEKLVEQGSAFGQKIWNSYRLLGMWQERLEDRPANANEAAALEWLGHRIAAATQNLDFQFEQFRISEALMTVYKLVWDDFCSWYLELLKPAQGASLSRVVFEATLERFEQLMVLLHPFMPFLTEELWQNLRDRNAGEYLMLQAYPSPTAPDDTLLERMAQVQELTVAVRGLRAEHQITGDSAAVVHYSTATPEVFESLASVLQKMAGIRELLPTHGAPKVPEGYRLHRTLVRTHELFILAEGSTDTAAEREQVLAEISYQEGFLAQTNAKLQNEKFVANAKPELVARERQKAADAQTRLDALKRHLAGLG